MRTQLAETWAAFRYDNDLEVSLSLKSPTATHAAAANACRFSGTGETIDSVVGAIDAIRGAVFSGLARDTLQQALPPGAARTAFDCAF